MRLRQIALVAQDLEPVVRDLNTAFGLRVAFRDPAVGVFGLINAVMPVGGEFLEVVQPVKADASAARYLKRRGGDAGYMLIFQTADAPAHRKRLVGQGIRSIARHDTPGYTFTHFHPGDFNGVLTSIDMVDDGGSWREAMGKWPPAGRSWKDALAPNNVVGIVAADVQAREPAKVAERWADLLQARQQEDAVVLDMGHIRFVHPVDSDGTGVVGIDIAMRNPVAVLDRAQANGIPVKNGAVWICGTALRPVLPQA